MKTFFFILFLFISSSTLFAKDLIVVHADWCSPCKSLIKYLHNNSSSINIKISYINFDLDKDIVSKLNVKQIPSSFIFDDNGKLISSRIGYDKYYQQWLQKHD